MNGNWWKYLLMILFGMFLMCQCENYIKPVEMVNLDYVKKEQYDSLKTLYADMQQKANNKQIIIDLLTRKTDSLSKIKSGVKSKYSGVKQSGRITIIENPCNKDSILHAYNNLSNHCDSINIVNDTIISVLTNKVNAYADLVAYKDTSIMAQSRIIEHKDQDLKASDAKKKALKKENNKLKIKNIVVTSVAILTTAITTYLILKK
jgi:hypothetical protein